MTLSARFYLLCSGLVAGLVIAVVWLYTSLMPMWFLESGYPIWVAKQDILRTCAFGSVLVMGDSRPEAAIIPSRLPLSAANISSGAASPIENYFFARQALKCPTPPRYVVYSHSILSFDTTTEFLWTNATRYGFITFRDLRDIAGVADDLHDDSLSATNTHDGLSGILRDAVYSSGFPSIFVASLIRAHVFGRYATNMVFLDHTLATRGAVAYPDQPGRTAAGVDAGVKTFAPLPIQTYYFDKTLALFAAAGVKVLYVATPFSQTTMKAMAPAPISDFAYFLVQHTERFSNVVVNSPIVTVWPDDLFADGSHLDERGAILFSDRLASCLSQWQASPDHPVPCDFTWK